MAAKICPICNIRRYYPRMSDMCNLCYTEGGWENEHNDYDHDSDPDDNCWICHPELNLATRPARKGHTNTVAKTRRSHAGCAHEVTPKARAACRKAGGPKA